MRYINLLDKASHVKTSKCFVYNNTIIFAVPKDKVSKAIGPSAVNIKKLQEKLGKKVRIISQVNDKYDAGRFIGDVVSPVRFKSVEVSDGMVIITAGSNQSKASLIGRNKRRLIELSKIIKDTFSIEVKVV